MRKALQIFPCIVRLGIGLVLVYSGMLKIVRPHEFLSSVFQYQLLGPKSATVVAAALPFLEVTLGVALISGVLVLGASVLSAVLFFVFSAGQATALLRGISADCGCFGPGEPISAFSLLRTLGLMAGAILCCIASIHSRHREARREAITPRAPTVRHLAASCS